MREAWDGVAEVDFGAADRLGVEGIDQGQAAALAATRGRGVAGARAGTVGALMTLAALGMFRLRRRGLVAADRFVEVAVAGVDRVSAAVADQDVLPGLAEQCVGLGVADQDVVVEGALDVLVAGREANRVAALDHVDPR